MHDVQPVVKIFAEFFSAHLLEQVAVGRGNDADVNDGARALGADPLAVRAGKAASDVTEELALAQSFRYADTGGRFCMRRSPAADLQLLDLPGERIAVNPQNLSGPTQVAVGFIEHPGDEPLVELRSSVLEIDAPVDHFDDQFVEQITHVRRPARGR